MKKIESFEIFLLPVVGGVGRKKGRGSQYSVDWTYNISVNFI